MAKSKYTDVVCLVIIVGMVALTLAFCFGERLGLTSVEKDTGLSAGRGQAVIELSDSGSHVKGAGAYASGSVVTIAYGGEYTLTGSLSQGQLIVDTPAGEAVKLHLSGVSIHCSNGAALWVKNAGDVEVLLEQGSHNELSCGESFSAQALAGEVSGALYSEDDLSLAGPGSLTVRSPAGHGIIGKDDVVIQSGSYTIEAADDGIRGRDSVTVAGGSFLITAGNDGIKSNNELDEERGWIQLTGGSFVINAGRDGVQAERSLTVSGGDYTITTGGGTAAVEMAVQPGHLDWTGPGAESTESYKGLKAGETLSIQGGSFILDCADDAVHSDGAVDISGGSFTIHSSDDAVHAEEELTIRGGRVSVMSSREGLEGKTIVLSDGEVDITSSEDGVNASGDANWDRLYGAGAAQNVDESRPSLTVSGGTLRVHSGGDGLDSNGDLFILGGEVTVSAEPAHDNSALDYGSESGGVCSIRGGTVVACGFYGMAKTFGDESKQPSLMYNFEQAALGGTRVALLDSKGNELLACAPENDFTSVLFSSPALKVGESYTVLVGDIRYEVVLEELCAVLGESIGFGTMPPGPGGAMDQRPPEIPSEGHDPGRPPRAPQQEKS